LIAPVGQVDPPAFGRQFKIADQSELILDGVTTRRAQQSKYTDAYNVDIINARGD
jgi:hypothetical protein